MPYEQVSRPNVGTKAVMLCVALVLASGCPRTTVWFPVRESQREPDAGSMQADTEPDHAPDAGSHAPEGAGSGSAMADPPAAFGGTGVASAGREAAQPTAAGAAGTVVAGGGGSAGTGGSGGSNAADSAGSAGAPAAVSGEPKLPKLPATCPKLATGMVDILGQQLRLWVGTKQTTRTAPMLVYWYATGSNPGEVELFFGSMVREIVARGGIVAAQAMSTDKGTDTSGTQIWTSGDLAIADAVVACAVRDFNVDERRIYTAGSSAGGLHAGYMAVERSSYIAAAVLNSGGLLPNLVLSSPARVPPVLTLHGASGTDVVIIDFALTSVAYDKAIKARGGFAVDCDHGGGHAGGGGLSDAAWRFLQDHPFGVTPEPYANGLPTIFPSYCKIQ